jgi:hypothetical protein
MINPMRWHGNYVTLPSEVFTLNHTYDPHLLKCVPEDGNLCVCLCSDCVNREKFNPCTCTKCACKHEAA